MHKFVPNRFLDSLFKTMLLSASVHILILMGNAIYTKNIDILNYFNILDIDLFNPGLAHGAGNFILGAGVMAIIYIIFFVLRDK